MLEKFIKKSPIKKFSIYGLFGYKTVVIPFNENVMVLMGENGTGKTTILNAINYTLLRDFYKLSTIDYEEIIIEFESGAIARIPKVTNNIDLMMEKIEENRLDDVCKALFREFNNEEIYELTTCVLDKIPLGRSPHSKRIMRLGYSPQQIINALHYLNGANNKDIELANQIIAEEINDEILYFPTYRRVEEDLERLGINIESKSRKTNLIQFGMTDVAKTFDEVTRGIKDSAIKGFAKVTGDMLSQLVDGINVTEDMRESLKKQDVLKIVLSRAGSNITKEYKENIDELIKSGKINQEKYDPLVYFLSNLIKMHDQIQGKDAIINKFVSVCNEYLKVKKIDYDESDVEITIKQPNCKCPLEISKLSSGEKQIVSLFCKIYLNADKDFIILFDEPELSLSIDWQRLLLPHILESGRCNLLLAVTHSPFIFENDLDPFAHDLGLLIEEDANDCR